MRPLSLFAAILCGPPDAVAALGFGARVLSLFCPRLGVEDILVVTAGPYSDAVAAALRAQGPAGARLLIAPQDRGPLAAAAVAALAVAAQGGDGVLALMSAKAQGGAADETLRATLDEALARAGAGEIVHVANGVRTGLPEVWNGASSGAHAAIVMAPAEVLLSEIERRAPGTVAAAHAGLSGGVETDLGFRIDADAWTRCPATAQRAVDAGASVAALEALTRAFAEAQPDAHGNVGVGAVTFAGARGCAAHARRRRVTVIGLEGVLVLETDAGVLVADRARLSALLARPPRGR